ncbi:PEP-utilizing enzyme [Thermoproteota archaeon]
MQNKKYTKFVTRRLAVQVAIAWNHGFGRLFYNRYGTAINNTIVYYDGKKTDYFVEENELKQFNDHLDRQLDNPEFVAGMIPEAKEFVEEKYEFIKEMIKDGEKLQDKELAELYSRFSYHHSEYYTRMWMAFRICERIVLKIESMLKQKIKHENKVKDLLRIFTTPLKPNDVTNERLDILRIAVKSPGLGKNDVTALLLLQKHTEKYTHIPMYDFDHEPYSFEHFENELENVEDPGKELEKIENSFKERKQEFDAALEELKPDSELLNLIIMLKKAVILRDHRDMVRQKLNLAIKDFYDLIGQRIGLDIKETALLTNEEIIKHLTNSNNFSKKEIEKRKKSFFLYQSGDLVMISSEKSAENLAKESQLYEIYGAVEESNKIKGITASPGIIKGIAKIIHTNLDFEKINKGDIMVAGMTRQDFVPVMRKASAIITSEGGVTCHAAIIARELGLPCIVGVENATQIINDGDLISVDGETGIVEKLKQKK